MKNKIENISQYILESGADISLDIEYNIEKQIFRFNKDKNRKNEIYYFR